MAYKCLIIDDDPMALMIIKKCAGFIEQLEVAGLCTNAFEAMEIINTRKIDLFFLDIDLPELSGISFIKTLLHPPKVIFITSHIEFAAEAFSLGAVDYLLKPISLERFLIAVNKVINGSVPVKEEHYLSNLSTNGEYLYFRANRKMIKVLLADILYVESIKNQIKIYRQADKPLLVKQTLTTLEEMLPPDLFIRIHRSFIVSVDKVTAFTNHDVEIGKIEIPIGRQYTNQIKRLSLVD